MYLVQIVLPVYFTWLVGIRVNYKVVHVYRIMVSILKYILQERYYALCDYLYAVVPTVGVAIHVVSTVIQYFQHAHHVFNYTDNYCLVWFFMLIFYYKPFQERYRTVGSCVNTM